MPKINDSLSPITSGSTESRRFLEQIIEIIIHNPAPPINRTPQLAVDSEFDEFYENYYVPIDVMRYLPSDKGTNALPLSEAEAKIIEFCQNPKSETRLCVFHGHTGVGKSTLIRRVVFYLYPRSQSLRQKFLPIYMRLDKDSATDDPDTLLGIFYRMLYESTYGAVLDLIKASRQEILRTLNRNSLFGFHSRFSESTVEKAMQAADFEEWVNTCMPEMDERRRFYLDALCLLNAQTKLRTIAMIDDVDRYSSKIHACVFFALDRLANLGLASIVCMRTSTYESQAAAILEKRDKRIELRLNSDLIQAIFDRRIENAASKIGLNPDISFRIPQYDSVDARDVIYSFCRLINHRSCMKALINLSNTNIKSLFLKLERMVKSEAFSDRFIVHQLLERDALGEEGSSSNKIWIFYHLLLGNYAGTFQRNFESLKAGLLNLFDSSEATGFPWSHFVRLQLLMCLYKRWRLTRDENIFVKISEIHRHFQRTFGSLVGDGLFLDALHTLIQSELIFMESCTRYKYDQVVSDALSDSARISPAGTFYIENFVHKVEYLYFIKDDIIWNGAKIPDGLSAAGRDYQRKVKFNEVLRAIEELLHYEYNALGRLINYWADKDERQEALERYRDVFSPYGLPVGFDVTFCAPLVHSYEQFIKRRLGDKYKGSETDLIIQRIHKWRLENCHIVQAFQ